MGESRRSRTHRPPRRDYRVTERDLDILHAIGRCQVAATRHLLQLFFRDRRTCARRLSRLHALGLLSVHVPRLDGENLYTLTALGEETLVEAGFEADLLHRGRGTARRDLGHLLAINDVRVAFAVACRDTPEVTLELFLADPDLRRRAGASTPAYIPDALVRLRTSQGAIGLVLEVDAGTESATFFASTKGRTLASLAREGKSCWGLDPWRPVVVARSRRRLHTLAPRLLAEGCERGWLGADLSTVLKVGVLAPVFEDLSAGLDEVPHVTLLALRPDA